MNNIAAGYFIYIGRDLYREIFFNHQPMAAWISYGIFGLTGLADLYTVVTAHRLFMIGWAFGWCVLLYARFGYSILPFVVVFETLKLLLFGMAFLSEGMIVYPLLYVFLLILSCLYSLKRIGRFDIVVVFFSLWFSLWSREPYVPLVLFLLLSIVVLMRDMSLIVWFLSGFILVNLATLFFIPVGDYLYQVFYINSVTVLPQESAMKGMGGLGTLRSMFYPLFFFFEGSWTHLRYAGMVLSAVFIWVVYVLWRQGKFKLLAWVMVVLFLSALRVGPAGVTYYGAFHTIVWFGFVQYLIT